MAFALKQDSQLPRSLHAMEDWRSTGLEMAQRMKNLRESLKSTGVHSSIEMQSAGFRYTGIGDMARCDGCGLEVSGWTQEMEPSGVHAEGSPNCAFVRSMIVANFIQDAKTEDLEYGRTMSYDNATKREEFRLHELSKVKKLRRRTFSHWGRDTSSSAEQMIAAGFFSCGVSDRTICLYCNLICQQWVSQSDDPSEVHKTLSPQCPYVLSVLMHPEPSFTLIINDSSATLGTTTESSTPTPIRSTHIDYRVPCHPLYSDITKRLESFVTWSNESSPSVDDLAKAGFFYTGSGNVVTCFYCNGSLQNWSAQDNPTVEHGRWFENCVYAKQLCGEQMLQQIREVKRARHGTDFPSSNEFHVLFFIYR